MAKRFPPLLCAAMAWGHLATCTKATTTTQSAPGSAAVPAPVKTIDLGEDEPDGLRLRLREGRPDKPKLEHAPVAKATKLSVADTEKVLARLEPIAAAVDDTKTFAFRHPSLPAPRTGETVTTSFPPPAAAAAAPTSEQGELKVLRFSPQGPVPIAPQMSVTFSQPMVAVTSHHTLAAEAVPAKITPAMDGRWRWLGTKTLFFAANERLPMATEYQVEIPAGTKSAVGSSLAKAKRWSFTTSAPTIKDKYPVHGPHRTDTIMFMSLNQHIDPQSVLGSVEVRAGDEPYPVRMATAEEVASEKSLNDRMAEDQAGRSVAFKAVRPLPAASRITVTLKPGAPSKEGPRTTTKAQSWTFRTHSPLQVVKHRCGWSRDECRPHSPFNMRFNNPLDAKAFAAKQLVVTPEIPAMQAAVSRNTLTIQGRTQARTAYRVTVAAGLQDQFGQTLDSEKTFTFKVGPARPQLSASREGMVVLDPAAKGRYSVFSVNFERLKVQLLKVTAKDWQAFVLAMQRRPRRDTDPVKKLPGEPVGSKTHQIAAAPDQMVETPIDLSPALADGHGQVIVIVEHLDPPPPHSRRRVIISWVQVTDIGLDAFVDATELTAWATALDSGAPLGGVELALARAGVVGQTDPKGVGKLELAKATKAKGELLVATKGKDVAILPEDSSWWSRGGSWTRRQPKDVLRWYVFDDRQMYRPKEQVHVKGWIRRVGAGEGGDVMALGEVTRTVSYKLRDARGNVVGRGKARLNALGGFDLVQSLPEAMNLGPAALELTAVDTKMAGRVHYHRFEVQEFRRPEFEVSVTGSEGPSLVGRHALATVEASYFAGGGLAQAQVQWTVTTSPGQFTPPNRGDFTFGTWTPWWMPRRPQQGGKTESFAGTTDTTGKHHLRLDFDAVKPARPTHVVAAGSVTDVNQQTWSGQHTFVVHPALEYVGLRSRKPFYERGKLIHVETIVTNLDGELQSGRSVEVRAVHLRWAYQDGKWAQKEEHPQDCQVESAPEPAACAFKSEDGGTYKIRATVADPAARKNQSEILVWVTGGKLPPSRQVQQEKVALIPNAKEYQPGDTAELLVQAPFAPAEGMLSIRRSGIVETRRFTMEGASTTLKVPVLEAHVPNIHVQVNLVGAAGRINDKGEVEQQLPKRPAFARGSIKLPVPPLLRTLAVVALPQAAAVEPGGETVVELTVKDAAGKPVAGSEVAVVVVDEAVLSLTGYQWVDPVKLFYAERPPGARDHHLRASVLLANPEALMQTGAAKPPSQPLPKPESAMGRGRGSAKGVTRALQAEPRRKPKKKNGGSHDQALSFSAAEQAPEPIPVRVDFNALAVFEPAVPTDAQGRAQVSVKLRDSLTRYRVMAVAVSGGKYFGAGESTITARLPLMVRPSAPRFLNYGDSFELPVVLQNQLDKPLEVDVALRATNVRLTDGAGRRVIVPANDRVEVRFPVATAMPGVARLQVGASSGRWTDAAELSLPVWTPATTEAVATYGEIDAGAVVQPVEGPKEVVPEFGGLEVTTSSTALQALTDAMLYLVAYPFECSEQLSSRVLAIAALRDVLSAFEAEGLPEEKELVAAVARDLKRLQGLQNRDGGFGFWRRDQDSWPYSSIHVAHALQRAKEKGFEVPPQMLQQARSYLSNIESHVSGWSWPYQRRVVIAYATYVLNLMGESHPGKAQRIIAENGLDGLALAAIGWILPTLAADPGSKQQVAAIHKYLNNQVSETAAGANFVSGYHDGDYLTLHSSRRADGVLLEALIKTRPRSDLIAKLVRGLLGHRKRGRWGNTQENVFILLALDKYFAKFEQHSPDFVARAWLGGRFAGEHKYKGRTTERHHLDIPMPYLLAGSGRLDLILGKEGPGRMYYRIGMRYAPKDLHLLPADHGFTVTRAYEAVDDAQEVRQDGNGTWRIKAGARVRVRLTMVAPSRRYHVALVDRLPAGLEPLNPALKVTGPVPRDPKDEGGEGAHWWWWRRPWFEHQNMRDERVEAFASLLWDGVHTYSYVARATTPGRYVVPPPRAEEMYHPETFGRGATARVVVE